MNKTHLKILLPICLVIFVITYVNRDQLTDSSPSKVLVKKFAAPEAGENPEAFNNALALLKTSRDGTTYGPNYKRLAVKEAREFKNALIEAEPGIEGTQGRPLDWKVIGPGNVSGRTRAVVVDPSDPTSNTWFAATIGGGIWKTTNSGQSWENKTPDLLTLTTATMVIAPSNPDVMYAGTGMGYGRIVDLPGSGIWKSIDGGDSWQQLESTAHGELFDAINRIIVDPNDENVVLACSNGFSSHLGPKSKVNGTYGELRSSGIFRSTDGGVSWTQVFTPNAQLGFTTDNRVQQLLADPRDFNTIYATVNEVGIIKSTDGGLTWSVITTNFVPAANIGVPGGGGQGLEGISTRTEMAIAPSDPDRLYAAVERPQGQTPAFFMSKDAGATWVQVPDTGSDPNWFEESGGLTRNSAWFNNTILVNPFNENQVFVGGVNMYQILLDPDTDTRTTTPISWWIPNSQNLSVVHGDHHWLTSIIVDEANEQFKLVNANDGGLALSEDNGATWTQITGLITTQFYGVDKKPGESVYVGGMQDNGTWMSPNNPGRLSQWTEVGGGDGVEVAWNANDPNQLIIGSQGGFLRRSEDGGKTFIPISDARAGASPFISKIGNTKSDPELVFTVGRNGVKRSEDFGKSWTLTPIQGNWLGFRPFDNVEVSHADPRVVWISSRMDRDPATGLMGGIHVSRDAGLSFEEISENFPRILVESSGIATDPIDGATAYILFSQPNTPKILKTTDYGQTFTDISGFDGNGNSTGFPNVGVFSLLVMPYDTNVIWAGTEIGLFISEDGGTTWLAADNGMPNVAIFQMSIVDGQVLVATQGRGVWTVDLPELANFELPAVTLTPRFKTLAMSPEESGYRLDIELKSPYDSTLILSSGEMIRKLPRNAQPEIVSNSIPVEKEEVVVLQIVSYKNGEPYKSGIRPLQVFPVEAVTGFASDLNMGSDNSFFVNSGFRVSSVTGFSNSALHTDHPYRNGFNHIAMLKPAIIVAEENAFVRFDEIVLVEEGVVTDYTDPNFFDFVIVEATTNGIDWVPLLDGYDSRAQTQWSSVYNSGLAGQNSTAVGAQSMYKESAMINLLDSFSPGDRVFIRFRLTSDPFARGWGWAIDNILVQEDIITDFHEEVVQGKLAIQAYPNPIESKATIRFFLPTASDVNLSIINMNGQVLKQENLGFKNHGLTEYSWDASAQHSGTYLLRIETPYGTAVSKLLKLE